MNAATNASGGTEGRGDVRPEAPDRTRVVLLVEDNETDRHLYGRLLWYNGYSVLHAADAETAIATALDARPDLILLDIILAGERTGIDVARRLRSEGMDIPMVVLSAVTREELGAAVDDLRIAAYLEKPIDPFVVVREVLRHVGGARPADDR